MDVSKVGGKGAGLLWLAQNTDLGYKVPEFDIIDASFYEVFLKQQMVAQFDALLHTIATGKKFSGLFNPRQFGTLEEKCTELSDKYKGRAIAVRSSAVVSEDSEQHSGAGLYDTYFLGGWQQKPLTPQNLFETVLRVYTSVNNPEAVRYRKENNLGEERMAVIVQEKAEGENGVAFSRMPARAGVLPVYWSDETGAVVGGSSKADIKRVHFTYRKERTWLDKEKRWEDVFRAEDTPRNQVEAISQNFLPLLYQLKERYGKEFDLEFSFKFPDQNVPTSEAKEHDLDIKLLQIRPLTNIKDAVVRFPHRKMIFRAYLAMGVGEYIGPWVTTKNVGEGWHEPPHYIYVASSLEQSVTINKREWNAFLGRTDRKPRADYNELTPNKRAIVITGGHDAGMHALTIANERGILCLAGLGTHKSKEPDFKKRYGFSREDLIYDLGISSEILDRPTFNVPPNEVSPYIRIVSDGLVGRVYNATWAQAANFAKKHGLPEPKYVH